MRRSRMCRRIVAHYGDTLGDRYIKYIHLEGKLGGCEHRGAQAPG